MQNNLSWISYIGTDGSIFYLAGPLAPVAGAQDGLVLQKHMGLMSPFKLLSLEGARQDGSTWTDTVYDSGDIMLSLEATGTSPQNMRNVIRQWISAWEPNVGNPGFPSQLGKLSVFTPDLGEWWANVRMAKNISDIFDKDYTYSGKQKFTWECHNGDAFWYSVDSVSSFSMAYDSAAYGFYSQADMSLLDSSKWTTTVSPSANGSVGISHGGAQFIPANGTVGPTEYISVFVDQAATDNVVVSVTLSGATLANLFSPLDPGAGFDLWACNDGTFANGVRLRCGWAFFRLSIFVNGVETVLAEDLTWLQPFWSETYTLIVGTEENTEQIIAQRNGFNIMNVTWAGRQKGTGFRKWGFGGHTSQVPVSNYCVVAPPIGAFYASDNATVTQSGTVPLTNMGDIEGWPRYLCYGPGTFQFGNGPGSKDMITLGPLEQEQVVLVTTEPRLRSVVDITPGIPTNNQLGIWKTLMNDLISFANNHNIPPLLTQFESFFGIVPPQGVLYSLLSGRFTNPVPAQPYGVPLNTYTIPVTITNGGPTSKIVAALTPRRRWPL